MYVSVDKSEVDIDQRKQQLESASEHITGLGDDAFWNATIGEIFLQTGGEALIITLPSLANLTNQPDADKQRMIDLAKDAQARL